MFSGQEQVFAELAREAVKRTSGPWRVVSVSCEGVMETSDIEVNSRAATASQVSTERDTLALNEAILKPELKTAPYSCSKFRKSFGYYFSA